MKRHAGADGSPFYEYCHFEHKTSIVGVYKNMKVVIGRQERQSEKKIAEAKASW